jgi:hypothetical protein
MTSPAAEPVAAAPVKSAALWEDFMDIFYAPVQVFRRREGSNPWPVILIITALLLVIAFATWGTIAPAFEATLREQLTKNPKMTEDAMNTALKFSSWTTRLGAVLYPVIIMVGALFVWLVSKVVSARLDYQGALTIVAYATIIDVAKAVVTAIFAVAMGPERLTSMFKLSFGALQFVDTAAASPMMIAILGRLEVFTFWYCALLGVGVYVIGKVSKQSAAIFAVSYWLVITVLSLIGPALQGAQK